MARSRASRKARNRDRWLNCQTRHLVESVLESVLDEKCKIGRNQFKGSSEPSVIATVPLFSTTPNIWTLSEADKEFMALKVKPKKTPGVDANLVKLIKSEEDPRSVDQTRGQPERKTETRRMSLPLQTLAPTDHYASESRRKGMRPKSTKQRGRAWRKPIHEIPLFPITTPDTLRNVLRQPIDQRQFLHPTQMIAPPGFESPIHGIPIGLVNGYAPFYPFPKSVFPTPLDALRYEDCKNENDL